MLSTRTIAALKAISRQRFTSIADVESAISEMRGEKVSLRALGRALGSGAAEADKFFGSTLPWIAEQAAGMNDAFSGSPPPILESGKSGVVRLTRAQVLSVVSSMFMCSLPLEARTHSVTGEPLDMPGADFAPLLSVRFWELQEMAKLQSVLHYFERVRGLGKAPEGHVWVRRVRLRDPWPPKAWLACERPLSALTVLPTTKIEDVRGSAHADFANEYIGGGVLCGGCVQEEIAFAACPECLVAMPLCERMQPDEAILITGAERFSHHEGYAFSLRFGGRFEDDVPRWPDGSLQRCVTAFDAIPYGWGSAGDTGSQFSMAHMMRDMNKARAAFTHPSADEVRPPALVHPPPAAGGDAVPAPPPGSEAKTPEDEADLRVFPAVTSGNWGCGAFNGDKDLKAVEQWLAASAAGRPLFYTTFAALEDDGFTERLTRTVAALAPAAGAAGHTMRVRDLAKVLFGCAEERLAGKAEVSLLDAIIKSIKT